MPTVAVTAEHERQQALLATPVPCPRIGVKPSQLQAFTPQGRANVAAYLAGLELERIATTIRELRELLSARTWTHDRRMLILHDIEHALSAADYYRHQRENALNRSTPCSIR